MVKDFIRSIPQRVFGERPRAESVVRNTLLFGFCILLLLIAGTGYWSRESFRTVEESMELLHQAEENHLQLVLRMENTAGRIVTEARSLLANRDIPLLNIPAKQNLNTLEKEMEGHLASGRNTSIGSTSQWRDFEGAYRAYISAITTDDAIAWYDERERMETAINRLEEMIQDEREANDRLGRDMSQNARKKVLVATLCALAVGVIVAALALFEIRRILKRLGKAYAESAESSDYLRSLLDSLVSGIVVIDRDGLIQTMSKAFRNLTKLGSEESLGGSYELLLSDKPLLAESIKEDLSIQSERSRYYGRVELGEGRLFDVFSSPLLITGEHRGLILVFLDITETERARSELRRNRALSAIGQMTAQIAHEIKNPLGSIRFATEVLKRTNSNGRQETQETIDVIERSVTHLASIVSELSEFARPKELKRSEISLNHLLDDVVPMVADRVKAKDILIEKNYTQDLPVGNYDATELRKLFLNLIINAIDASDTGRAIQVKTRLDEGPAAMVEVEDHGSGMDEETLRRLFEPFYTTKSQGTGLGMAIAKKIAELHRGDLTVSSRKGVGTTVTVRLPLE